MVKPFVVRPLLALCLVGGSPLVMAVECGVGRPITGQQALPHVLTVRVCEPADGVAEVSVAFRRAERVRALAFRMEGVDGRWRITALQLG